MSKQGWKDFLATDGLDDWVVLHGGATAVFTVASMEEAARLPGAVATVPGLAVGLDLEVRDALAVPASEGDADERRAATLPGTG